MAGDEESTSKSTLAIAVGVDGTVVISLVLIGYYIWKRRSKLGGASSWDPTAPLKQPHVNSELIHVRSSPVSCTGPGPNSEATRQTQVQRQLVHHISDGGLGQAAAAQQCPW